MPQTDQPVPRHAAALSYRSADGAPRVVAKGRGPVAEQIIAAAQAAGVPVHESRALVAMLMQIDLDRHIPVSLYQAVAEVLVWAHQLDTARYDGNRGNHRG
jgi:flagellar biosynthesis protein